MLFVGNDWAEDHHDVEIADDHGRRLAPQAATGRAGRDHRSHALIAQFFPRGLDSDTEQSVPPRPASGAGARVS
jgi:hypothetical protein